MNEDNILQRLARIETKQERGDADRTEILNKLDSIQEAINNSSISNSRVLDRIGYQAKDIEDLRLTTSSITAIGEDLKRLYRIVDGEGNILKPGLIIRMDRMEDHHLKLTTIAGFSAMVGAGVVSLAMLAAQWLPKLWAK